MVFRTKNRFSLLYQIRAPPLLKVPSWIKKDRMKESLLIERHLCEIMGKARYHWLKSRREKKCSILTLGLITVKLCKDFEGDTKALGNFGMR